MNENREIVSQFNQPLGLMNQEESEMILGIIRRTRYIELSAHAGFTDAYVERMLFPEGE